MSDIKLFRIDGSTAAELNGKSVALEKSLQDLIERNLEPILGVRFLASEYSTGKAHGGRIDTLGIDENGSPVIVEYKRSTNENIINQGLFYLDRLMDHRADFKLLVMEKLGKDVAGKIEWNVPRLLCMAGDFTKYDEHAVQQMGRNIELLRYKRFGDGLLLVELVNAVSDTTSTTPEGGLRRTPTERTISGTLASLKGEIRDLYESLRVWLESLGDDVQMKVLKHYVAFRRLRNFACVEVHPTKGMLTVNVTIRSGEVILEEGFTRDVKNIGHFGTGDLEIKITSPETLERAKPLLLRSYEGS